MFYVDSSVIEMGHGRERYSPELWRGYEEQVHLQSSAGHLKGISIKGTSCCYPKGH
jgi:hypothetical protein